MGVVTQLAPDYDSTTSNRFFDRKLYRKYSPGTCLLDFEGCGLTGPILLICLDEGSSAIQLMSLNVSYGEGHYESIRMDERQLIHTRLDELRPVEIVLIGPIPDDLIRVYAEK